METHVLYQLQDFAITHPDKVLFPDDHITKSDLVNYYLRVADVMFPYVEGRPVSLQRFPQGIHNEGFYQKEVPDNFSEWVTRAPIKLVTGEIRHQVVCSKKNDIAFLANQDCITPHIWLSRYDSIKFPDRLIIDLDPPNHTQGELVEAAFKLKDIFEKAGLTPFVMSTGSRGIHIVVPLNESVDFDTVREFAARITEFAASESPKVLTTEARKAGRGNKIYLDVLRNAYGQTVVAPYSVRPLPGAPIAVPLEWDELGKGSFKPEKYTLKNIFERLEHGRDPWKPLQKMRFSLDRARKRFERISKLNTKGNRENLQQ
jgi:bifunctional non-homologous end joining protein LigD